MLFFPLFIHSLIPPFIHSFAHSSIQPSIRSFIFLFFTIHLFSHPPPLPSIHPPLHPPPHPSFHLFIHPSTHLFLHPSIHHQVLLIGRVLLQVIAGQEVVGVVVEQILGQHPLLLQPPHRTPFFLFFLSIYFSFHVFLSFLIYLFLFSSFLSFPSTSFFPPFPSFHLSPLFLFETTTSSNHFFQNAEYTTAQILDLSGKLEQAETSISRGSYLMPHDLSTAEKSEDKLTKATKDGSVFIEKVYCFVILDL